MEMEVNAGECVSPRRSTGRANKSPRKVRPASGNSRDTEQTDKSGRHEEKGMKTSVLQGKVKALKEKQIKEKEPRHSESRGTSEGDISEDALVSPQLRTYLTEDLLDCQKQDVWGTDELWETCGSSLNYYSSCQTENVSNSVPVDENSSQFCPHDCLHSSCDNPCSTPCTTGDPHCSLSLAERVERNRLELRCKLNRTACHSLDNTNGDLPSQGHVSKDVSWLFPGETDADSGVSIPIIDDGRELSVRHEQAKQLLHRARMKAKGASPLRASHCVLPHPHSQPSLRRGLSAPGVVTDGGSQSDSSSSDYYSWHKGSRGSSPSHVRFQDESERDVQERYRERQHVPQTSLTNTPPPKRQANGSPSWTDQLSPSGHGQCGTCGSNIKASGASPAAIHGTNLRNVHLGSKITQDGSLSSTLGVKPSPHWILPSQPWRVHTELIRETHIGGDSTADSSGEEEGSRTLGKAPTVVLSRNGRLAVRTESVHQQLLQGGNKVPVFQDKKGIQSDLVPNSKVTNPDVPGDMDNRHLSTASMKVMEPKFGEALPSCKKLSEEKKSKEAKENKSSGKKHVKREPREHDSSHAGNRHVHCERYNSTKEESGLSPKVSSHSREENEGIFWRKEKCTEKSKTNGQQAANNERTGSGPVIATKDRCMELAHESKVQSEVKKGDIRSGMRKIFSSIGLTSRPKLERFQSSSLEQITPPELLKGHTSANGENESSEKLGMIKKSPSLQSLKLMSPFNLPRRASSVQNLLGKSDRSAAYITGEANTAPRRALSVEDIGSPGMARALGKVAEVYPDGTRLLELHCLEKGGFGFSISSGNGRPDSGIYVQDMSDVNTAKLYSGLLRVGDEILEVNGAKVSTLGLGQLKDILLRESVLSLRVLHQRRTKC
ncbi:uncharacterized protein KIAA1614 homolog [Bufo gargarizans]|uniref:uncharacterized protein KIAA1614 homolog n=1 Tax=Bufo gargarizans TaxID=30331 RepID=UPI001CF1AE52|nr:uncharacterized protein KIAA1614 homolog [Bufo gargarizans]